MAYGAVYLGFILARASCILDLLPLERAGAQFHFAPLTDSRIEAAHNVATQLSCRTSATLSWIRRQPFRSAIPAHLADAVASERICTLSPSTRVTGGLRTTCSPDFTPVPHLDTRVIGGQHSLLFGPYAGFSTRFLKHGSLLDLVESVRPGNIKPLLSVARDNIGLTDIWSSKCFSPKATDWRRWISISRTRSRRTGSCRSRVSASRPSSPT